jgi:hypothetical protein
VPVDGGFGGFEVHCLCGDWKFTLPLTALDDGQGISLERWLRPAPAEHIARHLRAHLTTEEPFRHEEGRHLGGCRPSSCRLREAS